MLLTPFSNTYPYSYHYIHPYPFFHAVPPAQTPRKGSITSTHHK